MCEIRTTLSGDVACTVCGTITERNLFIYTQLRETGGICKTEYVMIWHLFSTTSPDEMTHVPVNAAEKHVQKADHLHIKAA